ncbi:MAG TPA: hypothetical protein VGN78_06310 [Solirubrobacteraceae bacterium]|jgi:hypothetical protein|nr:hypothetical protein [Solirubrobacteraceae bacterium]
MQRSIVSLSAALFAGVALTAAGCGSSGSGSSTSAASGGAATSGGSPGALSAEAKSAATGDIPDNQAFITLRDAGARYSMQYPEGWVQRGGGSDVTLQDKSNLVHIVVRSGTAPTAAAAAQALAGEKRTTPSLQAGAPSSVTVGGRPAIKISYSTQSAANPVTGKRVLLLVDRYVLPTAGRYAIADLGTPKGVDNVDAYRKMIGSFRWQ